MASAAIIMIGDPQGSPIERLMRDAQRAATHDLVAMLSQYWEHPTILSSPDLTWWTGDRVILETDPTTQPFHFGERLATLITTHQLDTVLYFGGGSAPLLDANTLNMLVGLLESAGEGRVPSHITLTNNRHSSDWLGLTHAQGVLTLIQAAARDNMLAWALGESGQYDVRVLSGIRPATSLDLDTPTDLAIVRQHPDCAPHLKQFLDSTALDAIPIQPILRVLATEGSQVLIAGRVAPLAWQALNKVTRCWIRVFAEERGMVASERLQRGEVRSVLGALLREQGMAGFFRTLASLSDAAMIDSRVLMADALGELPSVADRYNSDLFQVDAIENSWLREFTQAAAEAPIPVLLGGHSVVAGGLYVLAELLDKQ